MQPQIDPTEVGNKRKRKILWISGGLVAILVFCAIGGAYLLGQKKVTPTTTITPKPTSTATASSSPSPKPSISPVSLITDEGVTWLETPQKLADLGLVESTLSEEKDRTEQNKEVTYHKVGSDAGKDIIISIMPLQGLGESYALQVFLQKNQTTFEQLTNHSDKIADGDSWKITDKAKTKNSKTYKSITYQSTLEVNGAKLTSFNTEMGWYPDMVRSAAETENYFSVTEFAATPYGKVYVDSSKTESGYSLEHFILRRPNHTTVAYQLQPGFVKDDGVPQVTWTDGSTNKDVYRTDGIGSCGARYGLATLTNITASRLQQAGKTNGNEPVYSFVSKSDPVVKALYNTYAADYSSATTSDNMTLRKDAISIDEYVAKHSLFTYKDALNRYILFSSTVYGPQAECGKPVVYLYPTKTTDVSVKVDADITVSDPSYNDGWKVTAHTDGKLYNHADKKSYDSLFWEGTGHEYPAVTQGFMVPRANVETTLRDHLAKLGMNQKESNDFMDFWLPKMPTTPYVRLTWFGTRQMDRLAPLTITPKPDSVIRIFLDFEGLNKPISLPEQKLTSIPRQGFTTIEWGGLLRK